MNVLYCIGFLLFFFAVELAYFKIADHYNIIDKPNARSSHKSITIRGGGIIFSIGMLLYFVVFGFQNPYFILGLLLICSISFVDDIQPVSNKLRIVCHLIAVLLLFYQLEILEQPIYVLAIYIIIAIGIINAINFMDGINGITGVYALVALLTLWYINKYSVQDFASNDLIVVAAMSVGVFLFFNFRVRAKCFAGDVGSVGIAFVLIFLFASLIIKSGNPTYLLLLLIYGLDTITTIAFRLFRRENIFDAHRSHFYQFLANEKQIAHPLVAVLYAVFQVACNIVLILIKPQFSLSTLLVVVLVGILFILTRFALEGKQRLLAVK